jgi:hypothetical protein
MLNSESRELNHVRVCSLSLVQSYNVRVVLSKAAVEEVPLGVVEKATAVPLKTYSART